MKHTCNKQDTRTDHRLKRTSFKRSLYVLFATILITSKSFAQSENDSGLTFDFKDVPLSMVLDYFSEAAGFVIMTEVDVSGSISVYTRQPLDEDQAVETLNAILNERGYAAVRKGLILKIVSAEQARTENLPVRRGASPESIPANDAMVTQVIPVSYTEADQLLEDLEPLIPESATITSNTSSNAIVITDTQNNIRRLASIVAALDTSISDIAQLKVYPLVYADAVEIAEIVEELFEDDDDDDRDRRRRGRDDDDRNSSDSEALQAVGRIVATADEYTNSLVVSASPVAMTAIDQLVEEMDVNLSESTELELVTLENADATETAQILNDLLDGESGQESDQRFGGFFGRGRSERDAERRRRREDEQSSDRIQAQNSAYTVADARTNSLIIRAGTAMMPEILEMVDELDADSSRKQQVHVYSLDHADADNVALILRSMFERDDGSFGRNTSSRTGQEADNPLNNRTVDVGGIGQEAGNTGRFQ